ncbi:MAG: cobalamin biosynthesis protein CbiG, partial [Oscillospiraceae bacterium]|nr:cobalamin biosynthesis protein CbiG [Oscillospiraceae bacterium]
MRCAAFPATVRGAELALRLREGLSDAVDIYLREGRGETAGARYYARMDDAVAEAFARYDGLIFIAAAGIAVRMIAPHVKSKLTDPAVLVIDERAQHVVSLLSGHVGGGNALARRAAACLGAEPVITTATDAGGQLAPDALAEELGLRPVPKPRIQTMNGALLAGEEVRYAVDTRQRRCAFWERALAERGIVCGEMSADEATASKGLMVFITDDDSLRSERLLCLVPRRLAAGIGCRRGVPAEALRSALEEACGR